MKYHKINTIFKRDIKGKIITDIFSEKEFEYLANNNWIFTEKIDGTNIRLYWNDNKFEIKGRTEKSQIPKNLYENLIKLTQEIQPKMLDLFPDKNVILYGEYVLDRSLVKLT